MCISLKFIPKGSNNNMPTSVQIMAWHQICNKPLFEPMPAYFTDTYMHPSTSMSYRHNPCWHVSGSVYIGMDNTTLDPMDGLNLYENHILMCISPKFVPTHSDNNMSILVQIMAWHQICDKPLFEPMMAYFTDTYMHPSTSMSYRHNPCWRVSGSVYIGMNTTLEHMDGVKLYKIIFLCAFHWNLFPRVQITTCQHWLR